MQIFLILAFSIAVLFSDDKLLFKGLVDNNYTLIKENLNKENINKDFSKAEFLKEIKFYKIDEIPFDKLLRLNQRLLTIYLKTKFQGEPYID